MTRKISYFIVVSIVQKSFPFVNEKIFSTYLQEGNGIYIISTSAGKVTTIAGFLLTRLIVMPDYPWDDEKEIDRTIQFLMNGLKKT
ncbi:Transcriptional regulator TetR family [Anoxybacillus flavithermus]|uniref:Transcriptional regulator TetR family n=1 Tax=Anoxybacillus flavithermus TaxID=33934 RepID=A0A178TDI8_9BACL|nr:Transcriptional regulator TetR family [Anoxybacillus flavithermus]OAO79433.1 Transcriptional regulator TetR family [Anoxybacillus flavithermus]